MSLKISLIRVLLGWFSLGEQFSYQTPYMEHSLPTPTLFKKYSLLLLSLSCEQYVRTFFLKKKSTL